jgi:hypothetical protein
LEGVVFVFFQPGVGPGLVPLVLATMLFVGATALALWITRRRI